MHVLDIVALATIATIGAIVIPLNIGSARIL
jgi:hypothetical protein